MPHSTSTLFSTVFSGLPIVLQGSGLLVALLGLALFVYSVVEVLMTQFSAT